jgi:hypothetical protein
MTTQPDPRTDTRTPRTDGRSWQLADEGEAPRETPKRKGLIAAFVHKLGMLLSLDPRAGSTR